MKYLKKLFQKNGNGRNGNNQNHVVGGMNHHHHHHLDEEIIDTNRNIIAMEGESEKIDTMEGGGSSTVSDQPTSLSSLSSSSSNTAVGVDQQQSISPTTLSPMAFSPLLSLSPNSSSSFSSSPSSPHSFSKHFFNGVINRRNSMNNNNNNQNNNQINNNIISNNNNNNNNIQSNNNNNNNISSLNNQTTTTFFSIFHNFYLIQYIFNMVTTINNIEGGENYYQNQQRSRSCSSSSSNNGYHPYTSEVDISDNRSRSSSTSSSQFNFTLKKKFSYYTLNDVQWMCINLHFTLLADKIINCKSGVELYGWSEHCFEILFSKCPILGLIERLVKIRKLAKYWTNPTKFTSAIDCAALNPSPLVVRMLHERGASATRAAIDNAAGVGNLETVTYLHNTRSEGCTVAAINRAAAIGHQLICAFLLENRTEGFSNYAIDQAATNGHLLCVQYLINHSATTNTKPSAGILQLVQSNSNRRPSSSSTSSHPRQLLIGSKNQPLSLSTSSLPPPRSSLSSSSTSTNNNNNNSNIKCTSDAIDGCCRNGHQEIVALLLEKQAPVSNMAIDLAASNGYFGIVQLLCEHPSNYPSSQSAIQGASAKGHFEIVKYLCNKRPQTFTTRAFHAASSFGHLEILEYLLQFDKLQFQQYLNQNDQQQPQQQIYKMPNRVWDVSIMNGHLHIVKYLHQLQLKSRGRGMEGDGDEESSSLSVDVGQISLTVIDDAATEPKNYNVIHYLLTNLLSYDSSIMDHSQSQFPDRNAYNCQHQQHPVTFSKTAIINAAENGNLQVLSLLYSFCDRFGIVDPLEFKYNKIVARGYVSILEFLLNNLKQQQSKEKLCKVQQLFPESFLGLACEFGHVGVIKFMYQRGLASPDTTSDEDLVGAVEKASLNGYFVIVEFLMEHYPKQSKLVANSKSIEHASNRGYVGIVQYLHEHHNIPIPIRAFELASSRGHLPVIQYMECIDASTNEGVEFHSANNHCLKLAMQNEQYSVVNHFNSKKDRDVKSIMVNSNSSSFPSPCTSPSLSSSLPTKLYQIIKSPRSNNKK
ncbi:hypothetical protein DFA_08059 [Cavenderia fasciculata]|uniref:Ankyrin repeat-containing protein n=1 Tax=Cavenderia fasciculata TaxID=261658 RepID=F4Q4X1_CACFS|nr:uncharacterized protein DFA_08059 [Cavenderia fasciculata]EGG17077.1 hypothetical protein DFA_08059 [Cavenderia fasciculata]|eukprot:XP_004355561.1 hypothetical protein DFA_08059 [Cavenderia fasciculata]